MENEELGIIKSEFVRLEAKVDALIDAVKAASCCNLNLDSYASCEFHINFMEVEKLAETLKLDANPIVNAITKYGSAKVSIFGFKKLRKNNLEE